MKKRRFNSWTLITIGCFLFFAFFFLYPISKTLIGSVYDFSTGRFTIEAFKKFFTKRYYTNTIWNSLKVTALATLSTAFFGSTLAYLARTIRLKGKRVLDIVMLISILSPPFIGAYSWIVLLGRAGFLTNIINSVFGIKFDGIYGFSGILLVFTIKLSPLVYLYVSGALKNLDNSLNEASESMGCTGLKKVFTVILPLILPTLLASSLLVFMRALADFGTPMLIGEGYRTLPVLIYDSFIGEVSQDHSFASAISVVVILFTTVIFLLQRYASSRVSIEMSAMNPLEPKKAKGARNVLAHAYAYLFILLELLPLIVVAYNSIQNTAGSMFIPGYSFASYEKAFGTMGSSIVNTYVYSIIALVIIVVIGILVSYSAVRRPSPLTAVLDTTTMFPYIIPGSVLGIAMLLAFNKPPLTLSGTAVIIIAAYVVRRLPYTIRSSNAILRQISPSVEEASQSLGANGAKTFVKVTVPMMISGVLPGALMSWMSIISELSASIMLYVGSTKTMTISIYTEVIRGNYGVASALSTILIFSTVVVLLTFFKLTGRSEIEL